MFWKVSGFSQPSPVEQILDREEFTLEELLDEEDIVQECKSLNGRLVAFLRERSTVEQLIKFLVEPPTDLDDVKRTYKFPHTACEVFCCEVEAVFNTLLDDADLMRLLFSLLDAEPPLACKTAGYFNRVVGQLLLRKANEMTQYLRDNTHILEKLMQHVDTSSVADVVKRLVGADEQTSMLFMPSYAQWLADTALVDMLLDRLGPGYSSEAQANAAEILSAIAHTQPSPLASKLAREDFMATLFQQALQPGRAVLVPALDVCIALIEPKRSAADLTDGSPLQETARRAKADAVAAVVAHLPTLVSVLQQQDATHTLETTYGRLTPPLGRAKLKVVELLMVLLRSGDVVAERGLVSSNSVPVCLELFRSYPFNNLLHHSVFAMLHAGLTRPSEGLIPYLFEQCGLLDWITSLPIEVRVGGRAGQAEDAANPSAPLRAGYVGHVTQIGATLESVVAAECANRSAVEAYLTAHSGWQQWQQGELHPRQELENTAKWACGRPAPTDLAGIDSDADEYQGMQPALYHRYNVVNEDDDDDEEEAAYKGTSMFDGSGEKYGGDGADIMTEALSGMDINDSTPMEDAGPTAALHTQPAAPDAAASSDRTIDDDEVLLATSDDDDPASSSGPAALAPAQAGSEGVPGASGNSLSADDMVIVDDESLPEAGAANSRQPEPPSQFGDLQPTWKPAWPAVQES